MNHAKNNDRSSPVGCEEIQARLTLHLLGDLDAPTQAVIAAHLAQCDACRELAEALKPTLDSLRGALSAPPEEAPVALSPAHRARITAAVKNRSARPAPVARKRKSWLLQFHVLEMAALFIAALFIYGLLMPAGQPTERAQVQVRMPPAPMELESLDAINHVEEIPSFEVFEDRLDVVGGDHNGRDERRLSGRAAGGRAMSFGGGVIADAEHAAEPSFFEPPATSRPESRVAGEPLARPMEATEPSAVAFSLPRLQERSSRPVGQTAAAAPAPRPAQQPAPVDAPADKAVVQPAEFDSVAEVRSPIVMRGLIAGRARPDAPGAPPARRDAGDFLSLEGAPPPELEHLRLADTRQRQRAADRSARDEIAASSEVPPHLQVKLEQTRIPEINFRQASLRDVVAFMNEQFADRHAAGGGRGEQIQVDVSAETVPVDEVLITFSALDITAAETLAIVSDISGMRVRTVGGQIQLVPAYAADSDDLGDPFEPRFKATGVNPFVAAADNAFSTFSIDVDTASYTLARNYMFGGRRPPAEAVRTEEFVNFFDYAYEPPIRDTFRVVTEIAPSRFGRGLQMLKIGVKGRRLGREEQRPAVLTFLVDSSGSMNQADRIGLVRSSMELLLEGLAPADQVAIIQFDNRARLILEHTPASERERILAAVAAIQCGGGTNLEAGLLAAYEQATRHFVSGGENRILLMSDGVVNLGATSAESIFARIEDSRHQGLYLSVFGFGMGLYDDEMLKTLATKGNGAYAFIDSLQEARRVFVEDLAATLNTIAEDVKIQVEFNPALVAQYRQLGYEARQLTREQFRDDTVDAGEVGSGQSVTALYELSLADLRNEPTAYLGLQAVGAADASWLATVRVRYRRVDNGRIEEVEQRVYKRDLVPAFESASARFRLAAGVAAFAEILRGSPFVQGVDFAQVAAVLQPVALELHLDQRIRELVQMVETASGLSQ